jgi:hypothetical protein
MSTRVYRQSSEKRRLSGSLERRGSQMGFPTWGGFLFGAPFTGAGAFIILIGTKTVSVNPSSVHAPYWVLTAFGVSFFAAGIFVWTMAWKQFQSNRRRAALLANHAGEPALADFAWNPRGFEPRRWVKAAQGVVGTAGLAVFLSMFNWWAFFNQGPVPVKIITGVFDLILLFVFGYALMIIGRAIKFGNSRIEFARFPYRLTEPIVVRWLTPSGINCPATGTFTLRCVEEWYEASGSGSDRSRTLVHEEQWSGIWEQNVPENFPPGKNVEFDFAPPANLPPTNLSAARPVFWEFEVKLKMPGLDFQEKYLVPVY